MNDLNSTLIEGRLTKDPVEGISKNGNPFKLATIASNRYYRPDPDDKWIQSTVFIDISLFGNISTDFTAKKGDKVRFTGALTSDDVGKLRLNVHHYAISELFNT